MTVRSAGHEDGNSADFYYDGVRLPSFEAKRGFNLVCLNEAFAPVQVVSFDTHADDQAANKMKAFIEQVPHGMVVLVAAKDSAAAKAAPGAYQALQLLGARLGRDGFTLARRDSYALIGCKGAALGSARELHSLHQHGPALVRQYFELKMFARDISIEAVRGARLQNDKFDAVGKVQRFDGFSIVAMVPQETAQAFDDGRRLVQESIAGTACLSETLPASSLHMTVCNNFPGLHGNLEKNRTRVNMVLAQFAEELRKTGEQFRAVGVTVSPSLNGKKGKLNVQLHPAGCEPKEPFERLRQKLTELTENPQNIRSPADDKLHINSWYRLWEAQPPYKDIVASSVLDGVQAMEQALEKMNNEVPLELPHLTRFPDMANFPDNCKGAEGKENGMVEMEVD